MPTVADKLQAQVNRLNNQVSRFRILPVTMWVGVIPLLAIAVTGLTVLWLRSEENARKIDRLSLSLADAGALDLSASPLLNDLSARLDSLSDRVNTIDNQLNRLASTQQPDRGNNAGEVLESELRPRAAARSPTTKPRGQTIPTPLQTVDALPDFKKAAWGMSMEQVRRTEAGEPASETDELLTYEGRVTDFDCFYGYVFVSDQLVRAAYIITEAHTNRNDFIADYVALKEQLFEKYGPPIEDESFWRNDLYQDDPAEWGFAVSLGHLVYLSTWETKTTRISQMLSGDNFIISHKISYTSKALEGLEKTAKERKALSDL